jgi:DNA polymerase-3 subunit alpha
VFLTRISPDILFYKKLFQDDFYLGVCLYNESDFQEVHQLYQFIDDNEYSSVAFPYVCYLKKTDAYKKNVLEKALKKEPALDVEKEGPYFLLSEKVIQKIYREKEINASEEIAKKISFSFFEKRGELITFEKEDEVLKKKCEEGLKRKLGDVPKEYQDRLSYELSVIQEMKFSSYFLLVSDYVHYAKTHDIKVGPGRGSAGGALTSFAMDITEIDPLSFHLSFERFLNPKRSSMPDIDIDFETRKETISSDISSRNMGKDTVVISSHLKD